MRVPTAQDKRLAALFRRWPSLSRGEMGELRGLWSERVRLARLRGTLRRRRRKGALASERAALDSLRGPQGGRPFETVPLTLERRDMSDTEAAREAQEGEHPEVDRAYDADSGGQVPGARAEPDEYRGPDPERDENGTGDDEDQGV